MLRTSDDFKMGEEAYWDGMHDSRLAEYSKANNLDYGEFVSGFNHAADCDMIYQDEQAD